MFGSRTVVPFETYLHTKKKLYGWHSIQRHYPASFTPEQIIDAKSKETREHYLMKSLMTIVCDSAECELLFFD